MAIRVVWNEYETALLIDTFWQIESNPSRKNELIASLSNDLRKMAVNEGLKIDDKFRNINGISMQLSPIAHGFFPERSLLTSSAMFDKMVALYINNRASFDSILQEAKKKVNGAPVMVDVKARVQSFKEWLDENKIKKFSYEMMMEALKEADSYLIDHKMSKESIFEIFDASRVYGLLNKLTSMRFYRLLHTKTARTLDFTTPIYKKYLLYVAENKKNAINVHQEDSQTILATEPIKQEVKETISNPVEYLIKEHYQYGFRIDSIREIIRLRNYAEADGVTLPTDDEELKNQILKCGTVIDGRVYVKADDIGQELKDMVSGIFESGVQAIYFEALLEQKSEWMSSYFITSEDMLKELLVKNAPDYSYAKKFMMNAAKRTEKEIVTDEIKRVWGDSQICAVDELSDRLPYIPKGNVWRVISGNPHFVYNTEGVYFDVDRLLITEQEEADILDYVEQACKENGFASLVDIPMGDIFEQNYEPSSLAVYSAIYNRLLMGKYRMKDKILTKEGKSLDAVTLLKQHIRGKDSCTFSEIADMVVELTGSTNRQFAFEALYSCMVRTEMNKFVADRFVDFNVAQTDAALTDIIKNHFCAIKDVTTFAMFPICGMPWNHYLLESYCYRFSKKFTLNVLNLNDKNAGIIVEKKYNKSYKEMLAIVAAKSSIALNAETIGKYLYQAGYLAKSKYGNLEQIAEMAKAIREKG